MGIIANSESQTASLFFGTNAPTGVPGGGGVSSVIKTAIIAEGAGGFNRNNLHFALSSSADNALSTVATVADAKMTILNSGNVGIGTTTPAAKLDVNGQVKISGGAPGAGKVLTSDAAGLASWQTAASGADGDAWGVTGEDQTSAIGRTGNVGIGTTTPSAKLDVRGNSVFRSNSASTLLALSLGRASEEAVIGIAGVAADFFPNAITGDFAIRGGRVLLGTGNGASGNGITADANNSVGIGTTAPLELLDVNGNVGLTNRNFKFNGTQLQINFRSGGNASELSSPIAQIVAIDRLGTLATNSFDGDLAFNTVSGNFSTEKMRILYNGRIGIGTADPTSLLSVNGSADKAGGGSWGTFSDARVKKNVQDYSKGLSEIMQIRPVSFEYNGKGTYKADGKVYVGVIAQEIEKVLPSTVSKIETEEFKDLRQYDSSELIYTLINAVKELKAEIELLKLKK